MWKTLKANRAALWCGALAAFTWLNLCVVGLCVIDGEWKSAALTAAVALLCARLTWDNYRRMCAASPHNDWRTPWGGR